MMIQSRLTDVLDESCVRSALEKTKSERSVTPTPPDSTSTSSKGAVSEREHVVSRYLEIDEEELKQQTLWPILVECVRRHPMYSNLRAYLSQEILPREPNIRPRELACRLSISIGEALVLLNDR